MSCVISGTVLKLLYYILGQIQERTIAEAGFYRPDAFFVAQPVASKH